MRPTFLATASCALAFASCAGPQSWPDVDQSFTLAGGAVESADGLDGRGAGSVAWSWRGKQWPCAVEFGIQYAGIEIEDAPDSVDAGIFDMRIGAAQSWCPSKRYLLVVGAGPRLSFARTWRSGEYEDAQEDSTSFGLYAHAGAFVRLGDMLSIGADAQAATGTDYDLAGQERDAEAVGLMLALRWDF